MANQKDSFQIINERERKYSELDELIKEMTPIHTIKKSNQN